MVRFFKRVMLVFVFGLLVGLSLNHNSNDNPISVVTSLGRGGNSDSSQSSNSNAAFMPPTLDRGSSGKQSLNSQDLRPVDHEIPQRFGYRTAPVRNYLIIQVVVIHGVRITKIINSLGKMFKTTLKCGLNTRDTSKINRKKSNNVI
jgi:hypothetical protein